MTRRGSVAYYLAAWICGCFFVSLAIWLKDLAGPAIGFVNIRNVFGLLFFCFYGLILGAVSSLLGGFLLRRLAARAGWKHAWEWVIAGGILAPLVIAALGWASRIAALHQKTLPRLVSLATYGPSVVLNAGLWLAVPAGSLTALVLYRIHHAFEPKPDVAQG